MFVRNTSIVFSLVAAHVTYYPILTLLRELKIKQVAEDELGRGDVAHELNILYPQAALALQAQAEKAQKLKANGIKQKSNGTDDLVSFAEDEVRTLMIDMYCKY